MTKLEEHIKDALGDDWYNWSEEALAQTAAEIAEIYIEKAFTQGVDKQHYEAWAKENGIIE